MFSALSPTVTDSGATKSLVHWSVSMILSILHDHGHERELRSLLCRCWTHAAGRGGFPVPTARSSCDRERQRGRRGVLRMTCRTREILPCAEEEPVLNPISICLLEGHEIRLDECHELGASRLYRSSTGGIYRIR